MCACHCACVHVCNCKNDQKQIVKIHVGNIITILGKLISAQEHT